MTKQTRTYGRVGLLAVAAIFLVAVTVSNIALRGLRLDLTENDLFTLSDGTEQVLASIPEPINLYFFFSDRATEDIPTLRTYARRVEEMLREFEELADGKIRLAVIDPLPFSESEDRAAEFGLQGINLGTAEPVYMGIAGTNSVGDEETITFLDPNKEPFLEYDLAKLVYALSTPDKPVIGLLSTLSMDGGFDPMTQQMTPPWVISSQLEQLFELRRLDRDATAIDPDIDVLMLVHPKDLGNQTLYAIDQFIMAGGRALVFVDPYAEADVPDQADPTAAMMASRASDLVPLFEAWGLSVPSDQVIGDDRFALTVSGLGARPVRHLGLIGIDGDAINPDDVVTAGLQNINLGFAGAIEADEDSPANLVPLLKSSDFAGTLAATTLAFMRDPNQLREGFNPRGEPFVLAARVQGKLPSAFPDGLEGDAGDAHLAASNQDVNLILIADTDMLTDRFWVQVQSIFGQRLTTAFASNGDFVINALDNLTGSSALISVRGRQPFTRPFSKVQELRRAAEEQFRRTEQQLQQQLQETEQKLSELQASREDSNTLILTTEQEAELERFQQERLRIRKELRRVQRGLDERIENLGTVLKVINIGLVPLLISLVTFGLWTIRRGRRARS